jgi:hypothetical protein
MCFDGISEHTGISKDAHRLFFHAFCRTFANDLFEEYCTAPTGEKLDKTLREYERVGLPGCMGSIDVVHVAWDRCPWKVRPQYYGKEKFPTIAYQVTCTHTREIISCTKGFPGAWNDKTIVRYDGFVQSLRSRQLHGDVEFNIKDENGKEITVTGLYLICDNGYHKWYCLQNPDKLTCDPKARLWSKWLESVRKDIECKFIDKS